MNAEPRKTKIWNNYAHLILRSGLPWALMILCFLLSLANAQLALLFADRMADALTGYSDLQSVVVPLFIVFLIGIGTVVIKVVNSHLQAIVTARVDRNIQRYAVNKVFYLKASDLENGDPRELITRLTEDTCKSSPFLVDLTINEIPRLYYIVMATVKVAKMQRPVLTLTLLLTIPVIFLGAMVAGKITFLIRNRIQAQIAALTAKLAEKIDNAETIKAYGTEEKEIIDGDRIIMELDKAKKRGALVDQIVAFIKNMMWFLPLLLIIIPPALLLFRGAITQAEFYAYILLATSFRTYTAQHLDLWVYLKDAQGATFRLSGLLSHETENDTPAETACTPGDIVFKDVSFSYGEGQALSHVSFTLQRGKKTALVGLSGSGKSTVLNLIEKFYVPQEGSILLGGSDILRMNYADYRRLFSYLPQNAPGFSGTVRDMLNYASDTPYSDEKLTEALEKVGLLDDLAALGGLEYDIGAGGNRLSGGQLQKLGIARLLLSQTEFVLMDEATSALDANAREQTDRAIDESCRGRTQIMVTHDLLTAQNADQILVFNGGRLEACGTHTELLAGCPFYYDLVKEASAS